jgi:hypothetical protein
MHSLFTHGVYHARYLGRRISLVSEHASAGSRRSLPEVQLLILAWKIAAAL